MNRPAIPMAAILCSVLGAAACEEEPETAVLVNDPVLEQERQEAAAPLAPEDVPESEPVRVLSGVSVIALGIECAESAVFFETDAAELGPEDEQKLDQLAACLKGVPGPQQVEITGRTDPRASETYNRELSRQRAETVAQYLNEQGVPEEQFEIRAMGERGAAEDMPLLWPAQRHAMVTPSEPTDM